MPQPQSEHGPRVLVHVVTYNHQHTIRACIESVLASNQQGVQIRLVVTDNKSADGTAALLEELASQRFRLRRNPDNLGFCGGHNQGVSDFLQGEFDYLLILNPDISLEANAILRMARRLSQSEESIGVVGAVLFRADESLRPLEPRRFDSLGIEMHSSLRHFDAGSEVLVGEIGLRSEVFGVTGACLMLRRSAVQAALLPREHEDCLFSLYPQLKVGAGDRPQLFDEGFFAYREDADLAWRLQQLGWSACIEPSAEAYHVRHVLPERRARLAPELNKLGVRNRFLLQLNNFPLGCFCSLPYWRCVLQGIFLRNVLVIAAVALKEWTSLQGLRDVWRLRRRALSHRQWIRHHRKVPTREVFEWFKD